MIAAPPPTSTPRYNLPMKRLTLSLIRAYQLILSPLLPHRCRFWPTCSHYAHQAIAKYGLLKGGWLAVKRLLKCGPWHLGGPDPVP